LWEEEVEGGCRLADSKTVESVLKTRVSSVYVGRVVMKGTERSRVSEATRTVGSVKRALRAELRRGTARKMCGVVVGER
jgi:hypothetical protein